MSSDVFAGFTKDIVQHLRALAPGEQRAFFALLLEFIQRESGVAFDSVTDFLTADDDAGVTVRRREEILGAVCRAIRENDLASLSSLNPL